MKITSVFSALLAASGIAVAATSINPAAAISIGFQNIPNGDTPGDSLGNLQNPAFSVEVTSLTSGVRFLFSNNVSASSPNSGATIKQVAFSVASGINSLLSNPVANAGNISVNGVSFNTDSKNLSQSNKISGWVNEAFGGDIKGGNGNGVQQNEKLSFDFTIANGSDFDDVITALTARTLQIGIHVGSLQGGASDSYYNGDVPTEPVPEPITMLGLGLGTVGMAALKRKYGKKEKAAV